MKAVRRAVDLCLCVGLFVFVMWPLLAVGLALYRLGWLCGVASARITVRIERCFWWMDRRQEDRLNSEFREILLRRMAAHVEEEQKRAEAKVH
jgi:hypothetical protein